MQLRLLSALVAFVLVGHASQAAQLRHFKMGAWYVGAYTSDTTGRFSHCAGTAPYKSNIGLTFSIDRTFHWSMGLSSNIWRLQVGRQYAVAFNVDRHEAVNATATAITPDMIGIPLLDSATLFLQFQKGNVLHIATAKHVFSFNLTNTAKLLPVLLECVRNSGHAVVANTNPFESGPLKVSAKNRRNNSAEATTFAANLLSAAGVSKFRFLTPHEFPAFHGDARWVNDTTVGSVDVLPLATPDQLKDLGAALIGLDAKSCKGAFLSGAMPAASGMLAHVFTTCRTQEKPTVVYYLAVPRKAGGAYLISTASLGSEKPAKEADANLTAAVMKIGEK